MKVFGVPTPSVTRRVCLPAFCGPKAMRAREEKRALEGRQIGNRAWPPRVSPIWKTTSGSSSFAGPASGLSLAAIPNASSCENMPGDGADVRGSKGCGR